MSSGGVERTYVPKGTCLAFHQCPLDIRGIRGPVGSGKSTAMIWEIFYCACRQRPMSDGVIRDRWLVLRQTIPQLKDTTIRSWLHWFPQTEMNWTPPYHGLMKAAHPKTGQPMEIELIFMGAAPPDTEEKLKALEISGVWVDEACQVRWSVVNEAYKRCGRFPAKEGDGVFLSHGVIMDTNPPDESNWWYKMEVVNRYPEMAFFVQPPALFRREDGGRVWYEPNRGQVAGVGPAENVENLNEGFDYYLKQIVGTSDENIRKLVMNEFGTGLDGKRVYPEWNDHVHWLGRDIEVDWGLPLILGQDFGRTPACVIGQMSVNGQLRIVEEICAKDMSVTQFAQEVLRPHLVNRYRLLEGTRVICYADPAGSNPDQVDLYGAIQRMNMAGIYTKACPGIPKNTFRLRRDAVVDVLRGQRDGQPAIVVGRKCPTLRAGFNGGYCYRKLKAKEGGDDVYLEEVDKTNPYSHVHDALQYLVLGATRGGWTPRALSDMPGGPSGWAQEQVPLVTGANLAGFF